MRLLSILVMTFSLSGCLSLSMLPKDHDPVLAGAYIDTRLEINNLKCDAKDDSFVQVSWQSALYHSKFLKEYTTFRNDPQVETASGISVNLQKSFRCKE